MKRKILSLIFVLSSLYITSSYAIILSLRRVENNSPRTIDVINNLDNVVAHFEPYNIYDLHVTLRDDNYSTPQQQFTLKNSYLNSIIMYLHIVIPNKKEFIVRLLDTHKGIISQSKHELSQTMKTDVEFGINIQINEPTHDSFTSSKISIVELGG